MMQVVLSDQVFAALAALVTLMILGLFGWVLTKAVQLGEVVARLEQEAKQLDSRVAKLEQSHDSAP